MRNLSLNNGFVWAAILLFATAVNTPAYAVDSPREWAVCDKSEDCIFVINTISCAVIAVNKKFSAEANQYISTIKGDGRFVGMENGHPRCLNEPEAYCESNSCKLLIRPE